MIHSLAKLARPQSCHARTSSGDVDASGGATIDCTPTQEDFDSATSVDLDVVKMTDAKLDPMLAEGGGELGKNWFEEQTNEISLLLLSQDIEFNPRVRTRFEDGLR